MDKEVFFGVSLRERVDILERFRYASNMDPKDLPDPEDIERVRRWEQEVPQLREPGFVADQIVGGLGMLASLCAGGVLLTAAATLFERQKSMDSFWRGSMPGVETSFPRPVDDGSVIALVAFGIFLSALQFVACIGVYRSRSWGLWFILFGTVLSLLMSVVSPSPNPVGVALTVALGFYCFLRVTGGVGPKPT